jgi:hypothetical protein
VHILQKLLVCSCQYVMCVHTNDHIRLVTPHAAGLNHRITLQCLVRRYMGYFWQVLSAGPMRNLATCSCLCSMHLTCV